MSTNGNSINDIPCIVNSKRNNIKFTNELK